jgi:hypothetical protein
VAGDKLDALRGQLVGDRNGLLRIAGVVAHFQDQLFAIHATRGVNVGDRHFNSLLHLLTESRILPGDRADSGDRDISPGRRGGEGRREAYGYAR